MIKLDFLVDFYFKGLLLVPAKSFFLDWNCAYMDIAGEYISIYIYRYRYRYI